MFNEDSQLAHAWICPERDMPTTPSAPIITAKPAGKTTTIITKIFFLTIEVIFELSKTLS